MFDRWPGVEGLEVTEAVLVLRSAVCLLLEKWVKDECALGMEGRIAELLLAGLAELSFSD